MMKWMLAAGAAALAIAAPTTAERGGGQGGGKGHAAHAQKPDRGGGGQKAGAKRGGDRQVRAQQRGGDRQIRAARTDRGGDRARPIQTVKDDNRGRGQRDARADNRGSDRAQAVRLDNDRGRGRSGDLNRGRGNVRLADDDRVVRVRDVDRDDLFVRQLGFGAGGCPPGLAKKPVACMPPGQAAKLVGQPLLAASRLGALDTLPLSMRGLFLDDDDYYYRWGGGYMYRVDRDDDLIASMIPLFGAALLGQQLQPAYLNNGYRPSYFSSFYPNSPYDCYDYGYGYVYERDCATGFVEDVIPTYDRGYGVGQLLPASYGYYNVPFQYRSAFVDNDDHYYRYAPGAIYRVDRDTALISSVAALLTSGLGVGQPLPIGYNAYNVPLAYRDSYYDRPDTWYRYDNGYIYNVDPGTRMVRSVEYVIV